MKKAPRYNCYKCKNQKEPTLCNRCSANYDDYYEPINEDEPLLPTKNQLYTIEKIQKYGGPKFLGRTKKEASDYIGEHIKIYRRYQLNREGTYNYEDRQSSLRNLP